MDVANLKNYLMSISTSGLKDDKLGKLADTAIEIGFAAVWGAYRWKVKRRQKDTTTIAAQAYTELPADFESIRGVVIKTASLPCLVDIQEEESFDRSFPYPANFQNSQPTTCKIVKTESAGEKWRIYWFRIPDQAYNVSIIYDGTSDTAYLGKIPSYMEQAVLERCAALMQGTAEARLAFMQSAQAALQTAIFSDRTSNELTMRFGVDPGWDDYSDSGRSRSSI